MPRHFVIEGGSALEAVLCGVPFLEPLRADELGRVARRFTVRSLEAGEKVVLDGSIEQARWIVVVEGRVRLEVDAAAGTHSAVMSPGDCHGEVGLITGSVRPTRLEATRPSQIATLDRAGFDALLEELPAIALPLASELARDLSGEDDIVRQLLEIRAERFAPDQLAAAVEERKRALTKRGARVTRHTARAIFHRTIVLRGSEPPFWMLTGFLLALGTARTVVGLILRYHLEHQLFALVPGTDPNPMHVHHFNYGMILIGCSGIAALAPVGRRGVRALAFVFGVGAGLVFDEFGLIYNLNPEYAQRSSLWAAAVVVVVLVQLTYFRSFWSALIRTAWHSFRSGR